MAEGLNRVPPLSSKKYKEVKPQKTSNSVVDQINAIRENTKKEMQDALLRKVTKIEDNGSYRKKTFAEIEQSDPQIAINYKKLELKYQPITENDLLIRTDKGKSFTKGKDGSVVTNDGQKYYL